MRCGTVAGRLETFAIHASEAAGYANQVINSVGASESLIEHQFANLDGHDIAGFIRQRAKSGYFLWKKNLTPELVGLNNLTEDELADHHSCRLGKWYDSVEIDDIRSHVAFAALKEPHKRVHAHGKRAAALFASGERAAAADEVAQMEAVPVDVVSLLDELLKVG